MNYAKDLTINYFYFNPSANEPSTMDTTEQRNNK